MHITIELNPDEMSRVLFGHLQEHCRKHHLPAPGDDAMQRLVQGLAHTMLAAPLPVLDAVAVKVFGPKPDAGPPDPWQAMATAVRAEHIRELAPRLALADAVETFVGGLAKGGRR